MYCTKCGNPNLEQNEKCAFCGAALQKIEAQTGGKNLPLAGFWKRYVANILDGLILSGISILVWLLVFTSGFAFFHGFTFFKNPSNLLTITFIFRLTDYLALWLYFAYFESSKKQATPGKRYVGEIVTDRMGNRISFGRASLRYIIKSLPVLLMIALFFKTQPVPLETVNNPFSAAALFIPLFFYGWFLVDSLMIVFSKSKEALQDLIAGTRVFLIEEKKIGCFVDVFSGLSMAGMILATLMLLFLFLFGKALTKTQPNLFQQNSGIVTAAGSGNKFLVRLFLKQKGAVNQKGVLGNTALMAACAAGHKKIVILLLKHGADVNIKNNYGCTALYYAVQNKHYDIAKILLKHGADVNAEANDGKTALNLAVFGQNTSGHSLKLVNLLLSYKANVNLPDKTGMTPLMEAAWGGNLVITRLLLQHGARVNARYGSSNTALIYAALSGSLPCVKTLIHHGAEVNEAGKCQITPLMEAAGEGHTTIVKFLLNHKAALNKKDCIGVSALTFAKNHRHPAMVQILQKAGAK
jgi:ankyrin repeat protein/uncharacterized RDD family membrane protein YckC